MAGFSFKKAKRSTFEVELEDGSLLHILPPSKRTMEILQEYLSSMTTETMVDAVALMMSDNAEGIAYTPDDFRHTPYQVMGQFVSDYQRFVEGNITGKN